jgi:hypothetical protein
MPRSPRKLSVEDPSRGAGTRVGVNNYSELVSKLLHFFIILPDAVKSSDQNLIQIFLQTLSTFARDSMLLASLYIITVIVSRSIQKIHDGII